jgi:hypothetical protein
MAHIRKASFFGQVDYFWIARDPAAIAKFEGEPYLRFTGNHGTRRLQFRVPFVAGCLI